MSISQTLKQTCRSLSPHSYYSLKYRRSSEGLRSPRGVRRQLFNEFLARCEGPCLQIAVKNQIGTKFGSNWISVDKYDSHDYIDRHDDVQDLGFDNASFNAAVCWSVLEHVPNPQKAVSELHRVLKAGGLIWVQLPFLFPYHFAPNDFWRVTPAGLRVWMENFEEIACGCDYWAGTTLVAASYFYGTKPAR